MDLDTTVATSYDYFLEHHAKTTMTLLLVLEHFTTEELKQSVEDGTTRLEIVTPQPGQRPNKMYVRFCLWYYINYVVDHVAEDC